MSGIRVVRAEAKHLAAIAPLFDGYRQFYGQRSDLAGARAYLDERMRNAEAVIFVAYDGKTAAGFTLLYPSFSSVSMKRLWILNDLYVSPDARRGGVGRILLESARVHAAETGAKGLVLSTQVTNKPAQSLYESTGWQRDDDFFHYHLFV